SAAVPPSPSPLLYFFCAPPRTASFALSLHDALPISSDARRRTLAVGCPLSDALRRVPAAPRPVAYRLPTAARRPSTQRRVGSRRSEEHTSELQSRFDLVCRLLLEKKKSRPSPSVSGH